MNIYRNLGEDQEQAGLVCTHMFKTGWHRMGFPFVMPEGKLSLVFFRKSRIHLKSC